MVSSTETDTVQDLANAKAWPRVPLEILGPMKAHYIGPPTKTDPIMSQIFKDLPLSLNFLPLYSALGHG